ncbi:hypothetical protein D6D85_03815 [Candidatus Methanodesulfokora washburnensis]|uniref:Uncharacterized protein n=1 Tax=Candidatus Methanodesulfokora washburnensis TaxID=2478471 RepID=A0A3R9PLJ3_9CREN|nr:hypothetical protein D6D85_03815 [Candidatus Methanodesulfokores washburnensis]
MSKSFKKSFFILKYRIFPIKRILKAYRKRVLALIFIIASIDIMYAAFVGIIHLQSAVQFIEQHSTFLQVSFLCPSDHISLLQQQNVQEYGKDVGETSYGGALPIFHISA